ncbi:protein of unknown function DUF1549 [Chthoniobacter flavus Ellin428]|uniref:S-layer protein n=1 Tax=Chthoniobacter flavus Ellin428 TaxID=497964 RepID=B4D1I0_9BACT|nr:DUF1549 domain-containing protein [Chthoniobacter flavus]EDY19592.1 protein of unknown function DUF1549 [Chthoniobacter flavus Ellin428]TCO92833.1 uncharacterized protein DUF1549 [Chthoniobacter flavus]
MPRFPLIIAGCISFAAATVAQPVSLQIEATGAPELTLRGKDAHQQLLVTAKLNSGDLRDFTHKATYSAAPTGVVNVDANGVVTPLADGAVTITAEAEGVKATIPVHVEGADKTEPINFADQIVPIFTKAGCNAGGCHGKASGQNGFKLSLLGFEPTEDYEHIVKEARGRRVFPASPENSLLLLKAINSTPHGGGKRLDRTSEDYALLVRWIAQGMPYGRETDPKVTQIEVLPKARTMALNGEQQLVVLAHYSDGTAKDVTRSALYEPNEKSMAEADEVGHVKLFDQPGDVAIMVRYQGKVATFRATEPLGATVESLPPSHNYIDDLVFAKLKAMGMPPSDPCDDSTFIRRVSLDIAGRLPTLEESQHFLADTDPAKRDKLIETLLASPEYADYFANKWSALLRNKRSKPAEAPTTFAFYDWIHDSLQANRPYNLIVRDLLCATGDAQDDPPVAWYRQVKEPQQEVEDIAQLFLGMRMQCAQCHHHPFEKWSQNDYYSFSAFFTQLGRKPVTTKEDEAIFHRRGIATAINKKTKQPVRPAALVTGPLDIPADEDPRIELSKWMSNPKNPFFARTLVNRYWKHFLNRGIVEPEDDMRETNPPSNPELLDALAQHFIDSGYDLKALIRDITRSQTYQLSAVPNHYNAQDRQNFSRYFAKRLTAEVLFDSINTITRTPANFPGMPPGTRAISLPDNSFNAGSYFLTVFGRPESSSACECERTQEASLAQALHLLNAKDIQEKLASDSGAAAKLAADPRTDEEKLRELYLAAYSRPPEAHELELAKAYLDKPRKGADGQPVDAAKGKRMGYEDIIWAVLNTKEFLFNH